MRLHRRIVALAAASVVLTACAGIRGEMTDTSVPRPQVRYVEAKTTLPPAEEVASGAVVAEPFEFTATELGTGAEVSGSDLYAERPMMLLFSVPTCPVCTVEAPKIVAAAERYPDVRFVIAHSQGSESQIEEFVADTGLDTAPNIVNLFDENSVLWNRFRVVAQPYYVLVDVDGGLSSSMGALGDDGLDRAVELMRSGTPAS